MWLCCHAATPQKYQGTPWHVQIMRLTQLMIFLLVVVAFIMFGVLSSSSLAPG
jgi:hypothetical protein